MKKILALLSVCFISSCGILGYFEDPTTYYMYTYNNKPELVSSEYFTEDNKPRNQILTAYQGYTVVDHKVFQKEKYQTVDFRVSQDVIMSGIGFPVKFTKGDRVLGVGEISLNGENYVAITADLPGYFAFVSPEGKLHNQLARVKTNGRVKMIPDTYYIRPQNFVFEMVNNTNSTQTAPVKGFDVKYGGISLDKMILTYFDYSTADGKSGYFEDITFPLNQDMIEIEGVGIKVIKADKHKLEYMLLN